MNNRSQRPEVGGRKAESEIGSRMSEEKKNNEIMDENSHRYRYNTGEREKAEENKSDRRRFNRPKSAGNRSFKKHNKVRFMKTERFRGINK